MADIFPERLERAGGVTALDRQREPPDGGSNARRRPRPPRAEEDPEPDDPNEPPHQLDRLA